MLPPSYPSRPLLYTIGEALHALRLSRASLYRVVGRGGLSVVKIGRRSYIPTAEIERWLTELPRLGPAGRTR